VDQGEPAAPRVQGHRHHHQQGHQCSPCIFEVARRRGQLRRLQHRQDLFLQLAFKPVHRPAKVSPQLCWVTAAQPTELEGRPESRPPSRRQACLSPNRPRLPRSDRQRGSAHYLAAPSRCCRRRQRSRCRRWHRRCSGR